MRLCNSRRLRLVTGPFVHALPGGRNGSAVAPQGGMRCDVEPIGSGQPPRRDSSNPLSHVKCDSTAAATLSDSQILRAIGWTAVDTAVNYRLVDDMHDAYFAFPRLGLAGWLARLLVPAIAAVLPPHRGRQALITRVRLVGILGIISSGLCIFAATRRMHRQSARKSRLQQQRWGGAGGGDETALALTRRRAVQLLDVPAFNHRRMSLATNAMRTTPVDRHSIPLSMHRTYSPSWSTVESRYVENP